MALLLVVVGIWQDLPGVVLLGAIVLAVNVWRSDEVNEWRRNGSR